jgi:hypothetical protein
MGRLGGRGLPVGGIAGRGDGDRAGSRGTINGVMTAVVRLFVARRHVDYGRVRSAICPAC